jgi:hypothetical protein
MDISMIEYLAIIKKYISIRIPHDIIEVITKTKPKTE